LIQRIKDKLEGGKLRWKLRNLKHRLLFVPENRAEYVALYKNYCLDVIDTILDKTGFDNPYDNIQTLSRSKPKKMRASLRISFIISPKNMSAPIFFRIKPIKK
jgi:hypothetical protein